MAGRGGLGLPGCLWVCSYSAEALCAAGWEVAGWLAVWLGFARVSRTFCQRGFKVAALSSHYQLGFFFFPFSSRLNPIRVLLASLFPGWPFFFLTWAASPVTALPVTQWPWEGLLSPTGLPLGPVLSFLTPKFLWFSLRGVSSPGMKTDQDLVWIQIRGEGAAPLSVSCLSHSQRAPEKTDSAVCLGNPVPWMVGVAIVTPPLQDASHIPRPSEGSGLLPACL